MSSSLNEDHAKLEAAVDRIRAVLNEVRSERRERDEELREAVRGEVQRQLGLLGLATTEDVAAFGRSLRGALVESPTDQREGNARQGAAVQMTPPHPQPPT